MKKLLIIAVLALCLTALVGTAALGSGGVNSAGAASAKGTFVYQMAPGGYISDYNNLDGLMQAGYYDIQVIVNVGPGTGTWEMEIEDCCITGDTMLAIAIGPGGLVDWGYATSPATIWLGPLTMPPGNWVIVITGYIATPGGFPAGYYWYIWM